jgi:predicted RNA binding protein YcfA (HicA-like mRNA interferase family)
MKFREIIRLIESHGWRYHRQRGSHMQYRHPTRPGTVTVPAGGRLNEEVPVFIANSVLRQAGLK